MPELPEVETIARGLRSNILGKKINLVKLFSPKIDKDNYPGWLDDLTGRRFIDVRRRGKNILIDLSQDKTLWVHLKMTGQFYHMPENVPLGKHNLMVFYMTGDDCTLRFNDPRRFGRVRLFPTDEIMQQPGLANLGPESLGIPKSEFIALFKASRRMIKPALLDQTFLAGLGNIYADESLYAARLHPRKSTDRITIRKLGNLHGVVQRILKRAIRLMGTSVNTFAGINGQTGAFQKCLLVYGREGQLCRKCGTKIRREKIGSRSAHYCPRCQRL
jgi:formamidopyrimidine-DNA glycosylase